MSGASLIKAGGGVEKTADFINILSAGMGGLLDRHVAEMGKHMGGTVAYFAASLRGLVESKIGQLKCTVRHQGKERVEMISTRNIAICNGRYFGSGMHVAPMADAFDGQLEVVSLGDAPKIKFALTSSRIYSGKHIGAPKGRALPVRSAADRAGERVGVRTLPARRRRRGPRQAADHRRGGARRDRSAGSIGLRGRRPPRLFCG